MPSLPRLSVVMFTNGPMKLAAAALRQVRPVAHEIVVAVDARTPIEEIGPVQAIADRVIRAEFVYPLEANLQWLHAQAEGDWILRLDGDDLVSAALVRRLGTPGWDVGITHAHVQYRWLWGGPDRMLDQAPWWPDPALRLIRNTPGIVVFPHGAHQSAQVAGGAGFWDEPIYHLDLLLHDEETRTAKAVSYERQNPGHRTDRGWSVSSTYYLPERLDPPPRTALLPAVDAAVSAQVLGAATTEAPGEPTDEFRLEPIVTAADRRTPPPTADDARIRLLVHEPIIAIEGRSTILTAAITNRSTRTWSPTADPPDVVGGQIFDASGNQVGSEFRATLPGPISPGVEALVRVVLPAHVPATAARVDVGLVQDGVAWHDAKATAALKVEPGRRVLVSTGISPFPHLGDDLITRQVLGALAEHLPDVVPVLLAYPTDSIAERFGCEVAPSPVSLATGTGRSGDAGRRSRDLVTQARLMAKGDPPTDPMVAAVLEPFAAASALVLAPGGGLASRYSQEALMVCAVESMIARAFGLPVFIEAPSIGPIEVRRDHAALAQLLNEATRITVRDRASADAARRIGRAIDPQVVPDPATAAVVDLGRARDQATAWLAARNVPAERRYAVVGLRGGTRDAQDMATVQAACEALPEHTALIFVPHCIGGGASDDLALVTADAWAGPHLVPWDGALGVDAAIALIAGATASISTRFHQSVLASAAGVRAVHLVGDEYDRLRIRALKGATGLRVIERDDPPGAAAAVTELLAVADPEPTAIWDGGTFAEALGQVLPRAPRIH